MSRNNEGEENLSATPVTKQNSGRFVYVVAIVSALGGLLFGYDTGVISGAILFIEKDYALSNILVGIVVSAVLIGAVIGAAVAGYLADLVGRRKMIIVAAIVFILGAIGTALTPNVLLLIAGRIIVGLAIGIASMTAPLYISEVAPANARGSLVSLNQLAITIGIVVSYLVDYALAPTQGWRSMLGLAAIPALILALGMLPLPDTPRWLMNHNEPEKARVVLNRIRVGGDAEKELGEIQKSLKEQKAGRAELLTPIVKPALIIGVALAIFQQVTGINTVIYYAPKIFQFAGISSSSAAIFSTLLVGVVNVAFTVVAIILLDRVGRRPLLLVGLAGMVFSLTLLGVKSGCSPGTSCNGGANGLRGFFRYWVRPSFLASHFRDIPAESSGSCNEHSQRSKLGLESYHCIDFSHVYSGSWFIWNFLVIRGSRCLSIGILL
jgi:SP family galactose:H+ symporter-like MFS transporter